MIEGTLTRLTGKLGLNFSGMGTITGTLGFFSVKGGNYSFTGWGFAFIGVTSAAMGTLGLR